MLRHAGEELVGEDHLRPPADAPVQHLLREGVSEALLEVVLRMESDGGRPDNLDPPLEWDLLPVRLIDLEPGPVDRFFRVEDETAVLVDFGTSTIALPPADSFVSEDFAAS